MKKKYDLERILKNYEDAKTEFNNLYYGDYQIRLFLDINFLHIYLDDLKHNKYYHVNILNHCINDLSVNKIVSAYEELKRCL